MKKVFLIVLSVFFAQSIYSFEFKGCSFKKLEKEGSGITVVFNCQGDGITKCFVSKDSRGFDKIESGELWKSIPNKDLLIVKSDINGITKYTTAPRRNGRIEGWLTGDCLTFYSKDIAYDAVTGKVMERTTDNIELKFEDDPVVVGKWKAVDFVRTRSDFEAGKKAFKDKLFLTEIIFLKNGKTTKPFWIWTNGVLIHKGDKTASAYEIKNIDGKEYMFLEWKSGDYTYRHEKPQYYVLEKVVAKTTKKK